MDCDLNAVSDTYLRHHATRGLNVAEQACDEETRLQYALSGIWLLPGSPFLQRWQELMTKYRFRMENDSRCRITPDCW